MRFKIKVTSYGKFMTTFNSQLPSYVKLSRSCCGISAWNEDLTCSTKHAIEKFWTNKLSVTNSCTGSKSKFYVLSMFPYPSGQLHMGHVRVYTISDVMARYYRMNGKNVIHPMGWDGFGLPAENAARENDVEPSQWTSDNIKRMKSQLLRFGCSFDWDRELATCDPAYYQWTQSIFLRLHSKGMAYQREALVNWDPADETVLADEQVDGSGRSWRSGAKVEKRWLKQWFIRTTKFAKQLLVGLNDPSLLEWRDVIKLQQHWIGPCEGTTFDVDFIWGRKHTKCRTLAVWTRHPELAYSVAFIAVSPNSSIHLLCKEDSMEEELKSGENGVRWGKLPCVARHPFTDEELPVIVLYPTSQQNSEGILEDVSSFCDGTDLRFGLPGEHLLDNKIAVAEGFHLHPKMVDEDRGRMLLCAGPLAQMTIEEARSAVCAKAAALNVGGYPVGPHLKDWLISRQRYWGTPIPMVHCKQCGAVPVEEKDLPILLPLPAGSTKNSSVLVLDKNDEWKWTSCPRCGGVAQRETDTMDTFVDSSWYFLRYLDPKNSFAPFSAEKVKKLMPVDLYIGGKEHAVLHLYYARFMTHFLHSEGLLPQPEPFHRLLVQGMMMGKTYRVKKSGKYLHSEEVEVDGKKAFEKHTREPVSVSWEKMSKSKYNGVEPSDMIDKHGVDTTRLLVLADVAPTSHRKWTPETIPGIINWQRRLWLMMRQFRELRSHDEQLPRGSGFEEEELQLWDSRNFYLKGATFNYKFTHQLSVAISKMQGLTNSLRRAPPAIIQQGLQFERALAVQLLLLAPMAPHFASELWFGFVTAPRRVNLDAEEIDWKSNVLEQKWPEVDCDYCLELIGKLNGNEKCRIKMPRDELDGLGHKEALQKCLSHPSFAAVSETPYVSARVQEERRWHVVDSKYDLYPGCQASLNIVTEAGVNLAEFDNERRMSEDKENAKEVPQKKQRVQK